MTRSPEPSALPSLTLRGSDGRIWLQGRAVLLERDGVRRRIPVAAIAEARVTGASRRTVEIVVRGSDGVPGPVFGIEGRDATAAGRLVVTVNQALPGEALLGGVELVEVLPLGSAAGAKRADPRARAVLLAFLAVYVAGLVVLALAGEAAQPLLWGLGVMPLAAGLLVVVPAVGAVRDRWILRGRGVTVVAMFDRAHGKKRFFRFTDEEGVSREILADYAAVRLDGDPQRIEVTYDPLRPTRAVALMPTPVLVLRALGVVIFGLPVLLIGLYMVPYQLVTLLTS
ncbi:hypothetical protein ACFYWX_27445 [Streptomyces sp. NPDC002888]|uniref:hypothetical protein n=1 Tax=Streptomyces sp. NPDC002888 TaxID=3364668 RepID=UPI0036A91E6D